MGSRFVFELTCGRAAAVQPNKRVDGTCRHSITMTCRTHVFPAFAKPRFSREYPDLSDLHRVTALPGIDLSCDLVLWWPTAVPAVPGSSHAHTLMRLLSLPTAPVISPGRCINVVSRRYNQINSAPTASLSSEPRACTENLRRRTRCRAG